MQTHSIRLGNEFNENLVLENPIFFQIFFNIFHFCAVLSYFATCTVCFCIKSCAQQKNIIIIVIASNGVAFDKLERGEKSSRLLFRSMHIATTTINFKWNRNQLIIISFISVSQSIR